MAVAAARRAARILVPGTSIDPLVSTMSTTAFSLDEAPAAASSPVTVTTAFTSDDPSGRNSFWYTDAEKLMRRVLSPGKDRVGEGRSAQR